MADMRDFYYRQQVSEDELDGAFSGLETADRNVLVDLDFIARDDPDPTAKATHGGIMWGWGLSLSGGMDLIVQAGAGYDESGQRVATTTSLVLNCANDGYTAIGAGGLPTGSSTDPGVGNERWLSILIAFDRKLSDGRYDGYNNLVYFARNESFKFRVKAGATGAIGSNPARPAREANEILLDDVLVTNAAGSASIASIDTAAATRRKEYFFNYTATNTPLAPLAYDPLSIKGKGNIRDVLTTLVEMLNDHVGGHDIPHSGEHLAWDNDGHVWADGQAGITGTATSLSDGLWSIIDDLAADQPVGVARAGTTCVGVRALTGAAGTQAHTSPLSLAQDDLQTNLEAILTALNSRVFRGGDDTIGGRLAPAADGTALGISGGNRWDAYLRDLYLNGAVGSSLIPSLTGTFDLGNVFVRWQNIWAANLISTSGSIEAQGYVWANVLRSTGDADIDGSADIEGSVDIDGSLVVHGTGSTDHGVKGYTAGSGKSGVYGEAGTGNFAGLEGIATDPANVGVFGGGDGVVTNHIGVMGSTDTNTAVYGVAVGGTGISGYSVDGAGVLGFSLNGAGVAGSSFAFDVSQTIFGQWSLSAMQPENGDGGWKMQPYATFFEAWQTQAQAAGTLVLNTTDFPEGMKLLNVYVLVRTAAAISFTVTVLRNRRPVDANGAPTGSGSAHIMGASTTLDVVGTETLTVACTGDTALSHANGAAGDSDAVVVRIDRGSTVVIDYVLGVFFKAEQYGATRWIGHAVP